LLLKEGDARGNETMQERGGEECVTQQRKDRIELVRRERIVNSTYLQLFLESCCERDLVEA
jgi:hypothetical protein